MSFSKKSYAQTEPGIADYVELLFQPVDAPLASIRANSKAAGLPDIQVGPMDGRHLEVLARMLNPRLAVEIGTLGGYSGLCLARGIQPGGTLFTFEKNEKHAVVAKENLERTLPKENLNVNFKIHVGSAIELLPGIESEGPFDLVFIDADKPGYPGYLKWAVDNLRIGGVVIGDNTFAWGEVHRAHEKIGNDLLMVGSLDKFNRSVAADSRMRGTIFPTAEGLTVAVKVRN
ncbi:MAG: O-methyltransferase [Deltaproteobacteria bacterium]|jgi:caffeoyl-CoA O-methyltransferase|nr:O-methyltransferase [Deltaproteobacteria bacterium]